VNIFDFDKEIYGEDATILFHKRLRDELKFAGIEELKAQLNVDKLETMKVFGK
jgi:riboflavin kinase/FMN adenylyltransferase